MRDYKDIWNEAYNSAIEDGKTEQEAIKVAENAVEDYLSEDGDGILSRSNR